MEPKAKQATFKRNFVGRRKNSAHAQSTHSQHWVKFRHLQILGMTTLYPHFIRNK
ncbi:hypothetical protein EBME_1888 [bacterium endosymbiont of Mortierella elongata FMR23-6]|nr:hypothetical protein EBME_1888 [bacterium endosymbiont of Mortierella elongata FMR23-6]